MGLRKGATFHLLRITSFLILIIAPINLIGNDDVFKFEHKKKHFLKPGEVYSIAFAKDEGEKNQKFWMRGQGIHKKKCRRIIPRLSRYESFQEWVSFIKLSEYNEKTQLLHWVLDHTLLPYKMVLKFKIARIKDSSTTPFVFETGFLAGLKGQLHWRDLGRGCFLSVEAHRNGKHTKISSTLLELFTQTLTKLAIEKLFRIALPG